MPSPTQEEEELRMPLDGSQVPEGEEVTDGNS